MKQKHIDMRIKQCILLSEASNCPRRRFGAMLLDPKRNVVLSDGYNGGPRGGEGGGMCRGSWCERDGITRESIKIVSFTKKEVPFPRCPESETEYLGVSVNGTIVFSIRESEENSLEIANSHLEEMIKDYPSIESGKQMEKGCHHAEANVLCNSASNGVSTRGAWMIVTGEPCLMCAKLIHHSGVERVICVENGYKGGKAGPEYLTRNGVEVVYTEGPEDPRL